MSGSAAPVVPPDLLSLAEDSRYKEISVIGSGAHGLVLRAVDTKKGDHVALKCLQRGEKITKYVEREIMNQLRLKHPHIIAIREVFLSDDHLVLVLDLAAGGDLLKYVAKAGRLSEDDARWFFQQIMFAMHYSHRMGVSNRDVKLENVLLATIDPRPIVRLSDFGFSKDENYHSAPGSRVGTPAYLAPEVISNVTGGSYDAKKADVWSCGVLLFVMVAGRYPFTRAEDERQPGALGLQASFQRILNVEYSFPKSRPLSENCKDLISSMLCKDPNKRLSVEAVLQHPWCSTDMNPQLLAFNESLVAQSMATLLAQEVVKEIESIVQEARRPGPRQQQLAQQYNAMAGMSQHSVSLFDEDLLVDSAAAELDDIAF